MTEAAETCITACRAAHRACLTHALAACHDADGRLLRLTIQTAQMAELMCDFLLGASPVAGRTALVCAELSDLCARGWRPRARDIAEVCAGAARACRELARQEL